MKNLDHLRSLSKNEYPLSTNFMSLSHPRSLHFYPSILILLMQHLQLLAQALLISSETKTDKTSWSEFFRGLVYAAKVLNPGYLLKFEPETQGTELILIIFAVLSAAKLVLIGYIIFILIKNLKGNKTLITLWKCIFTIQAPFLGFIVSSICIETIRAQKDGEFLTDQTEDYLVKAGFGIILILEYAISFVILVFYLSILPLKSFLASKSHVLATMTLIQKLILQLSTIDTSLDPLTTQLILALINLLFSLLRLRMFFFILPFYNPKVNKIKIVLIITQFCLDLINLIDVISKDIGNEISGDTFLMLWIILTILSGRACVNYLNRLEIDLVTKSTKRALGPLLSKIALIKHFRAKKLVSTESTATCNWEYFVNLTTNTKIQQILELEIENPQPDEININNKQYANNLFVRYLKGLRSKFPRDDLLKLYIAWYEAKKLKKYGKAIKTLLQLQQQGSKIFVLNASLLLKEIQEMLYKKKETEDKKRIDIFKYIQSISALAQLKTQMVEQAELQYQVYDELSQTSPDLQRILNLTQQAHRVRSSIKKKYNTMNKIIPDWYYEPQVLWSHYTLSLNHNLPKYLKLEKSTIYKLERYEKHLNASELNQKNAYMENSELAVISASKQQAGRIVFCSGHLLKLYGQDLMGRDVSCLVFPLLQDPSEDLLTRIKKGNYSDSKGVVRSFAQNIEGYIFPIDYFIKLSPFISNGLTYFAIIRPVLTSQEYILISEDGNIEAFSRQIGYRLGFLSIRKSKANISVICRELAQVNQAFNVVYLSNSHQITKTDSKLLPKNTIPMSNYGSFLDGIKERGSVPTMDLQNATKLYHIYTAAGQVVQFKPLENSLDPKKSKEISYLCKVESKMYGNIHFKLVTLEETMIKVKNSQLPQKGTLLRNLSTKNDPEEDGDYGTIMKEHLEKDEKKMDRLATKPVQEILLTTELFSSGRGLMAKHSLNTETEKGLDTQQDLIQRTFTYNTANAMRKDNVSAEKLFRQLITSPQSATSRRSNAVTAVKITKVFNSALKVKYSSKVYRFLILLLFMMFSGIAASQISLKVIMDNYATSIKARKDVLNIAIQRTVKQIDIHRQLRYIWSFGVGNQNQMVFPVNRRVPAMITRINSSLADLASTNRDLRISTSFLADVYRERLFRKTLRIFDTYYNETPQKWMNLTTFEGTDRLISDCYQVIYKAQKSLAQTMSSLTILLRNMVNDILIRTKEFIDVFSASLTDDQAQERSIINVNLIVMMVFLGLFTIFFGIVIKLQYQREKQNMVSLTGIDIRLTKQIQQKMTEFKQVVLQETVNIHSLDRESIISSFMKINYKGDDQPQGAKKRKLQSSRIPKDIGLIKKYFIYILELIMLMLIPIIILSLSFVSQIWTINSLAIKINIIHNLGIQAAKVDIVGSAFLDLLAENGTTYMRGEPVGTTANKLIKEINVVKNSIIDLMGQDEESDSEVCADILFNDGCKYLTGTLFTYCQTNARGQNLSSLTQITTDLEYSLATLKARYDNSNKSQELLRGIEYELQNNTISVIVMMQRLFNLSSADMDANVNGAMIELKSGSLWKCVGICVISAVVCFVIYVLVLARVREADNDFKKVLKLFPGHLILSRYKLKAYLLETSRGVLETIKNEI